MLAALALACAAAATVAPKSPPAQVAPEQAVAARPRIDVAFALDTTGSMGDEIDVVKERIVEIARKVASGQPRPDVRFGIVAYRDRGDLYLTKVFPFSREIADVQKALASLDADGGGDEPEAVAEGLFVAVHELSWDKAQGVSKLIFLIGDAGPHEYPDGKSWRAVAGEARQAGITIHAIGCSGLSAWGDGVFAEIARRTGGALAHLTYAVATVGADGRARTLLHEGAHAYVADKPLSEAEWKRGADELRKEGKVRAARPEEIAAAAPIGAGSGAVRSLARIGDRRAPAGPPAAAADSNNLDAEIAGRILDAAKAQGVAY